MTRRRLISLAALLAFLGLSLALPGDAHARRYRYRGWYGSTATSGYYGTATYGTTNSSAAPTSGTCAPTAPPVNPDGSIAPQPGQAAPPPPAAPPAT
jgi:hypothetical protein